MRGKTETYKCKRCKCEFVARVADRNRGWARFCSKSCKAGEQEKRTGQMGEYLCRRVNREYDPEDYEHPHDSHSLGQW